MRTVNLYYLPNRLVFDLLSNFSSSIVRDRLSTEIWNFSQILSLSAYYYITSFFISSSFTITNCFLTDFSANYLISTNNSYPFFFISCAVLISFNSLTVWWNIISKSLPFLSIFYSSSSFKYFFKSCIPNPQKSLTLR